VKLLLATCLATFLPSPAQAQEGAAPARDTLTIVSRHLGEARPINVHLPVGFDRNTKYPVLYMPDGGIDEDFPHLVKTVDSLIAAHEIRPVIVVGIPNTQRRRDLTGPTRFAADSAIAPRVGGSAAFRAFIRDELIPAIEARYPTTSERSIIGESLAGLFIVETFLLEPALFTHAIALDPSFWWNGGALLDSAAVLLARAPASPRSLYLASSNVPEISVGTARLAELLRTPPTRWVTAIYEPHPELTHATIFQGVKALALIVALRVPSPGTTR
jgi:predicted alpha/beta superfamily hydrolase